MTMFTFFKNIGNNWITEPQQELFYQFMEQISHPAGKMSVVCVKPTTEHCQE